VPAVWVPCAWTASGVKPWVVLLLNTRAEMTLLLVKRLSPYWVCLGIAGIVEAGMMDINAGVYHGHFDAITRVSRPAADLPGLDGMNQAQIRIIPVGE